MSEEEVGERAGKGCSEQMPQAPGRAETSWGPGLRLWGLTARVMGNDRTVSCLSQEAGGGDLGQPGPGIVGICPAYRFGRGSLFR